VKALMPIFAAAFLPICSPAIACDGPFNERRLFSSVPFSNVPKGAVQLLVEPPKQQKISRSGTVITLGVRKVMNGRFDKKFIAVNVSESTSCSRYGLPDGDVYVIGFEVPIEESCFLKDMEIGLFQAIEFALQQPIASHLPKPISQRNFDSFRSRMQKPMSCVLAKKQIDVALGYGERIGNPTVRTSPKPAIRWWPAIVVVILLFGFWFIWKQRKI
jgi:hypothetical protein